MTQPRAVVFAVFSLPVQLRDAEHGDLQFAGESFEPAGNAGHLFLTRVLDVVGFDQLQVVDNDQPQPAFAAADAACGRRDLGDLRAGESSTNSGALLNDWPFRSIGRGPRWKWCRCAGDGR